MHDQEQGAGTRFDKRGLALTAFRLQRVGDRSEQRLAAACCSGLAGDGRNGNSSDRTKSRGSPDNTPETKEPPGSNSGTDTVLDHMLRAGLVLLRYHVSVLSAHYPLSLSGCHAFEESWCQER